MSDTTVSEHELVARKADQSFKDLFPIAMIAAGGVLTFAWAIFLGWGALRLAIILF